MISSDKIVELYKELLEYTSLINDGELIKLIEAFDEQLLMAPNSLYDQYGGCYQGGWLYHCVLSLKIADKEYRSIYQTICEQFSESALQSVITFNKKSLYKTIILSNISKIGQPAITSFIKKSKTSTYGRNTKYDFNSQLPRMKYQDRAIYLANKYSIKLTREQTKAILSASRLTSEQKSSYFIDYIDLSHIQQTILPTIVAICNLNAFKILKMKEYYK